MAAPALTDLQVSILQSLWRHGEATVQTVQQDLQRLAPSTVATLLGRMEKRGLVTHRQAKRQYIYRALVTEPEVQRTVVEELSTLVSQLISARDISPQDLARIKASIEDKERELRGRS